MMICSKCGHENSELSKFCIGCGAALEAAPVAEPVLQEDTVTEPVVGAMPPVEEPKEATATETNPYYQPYQPPVQQQPPVQPTTPAQPTSYYYQPPVAPQNTGEKPVSFGKWMGIMALEYFLGFVHLIMMFVWGFSSGTEESLKNYARARLVWAAIGLAFFVVILVLLAFLGHTAVDVMDEFMYY